MERIKFIRFIKSLLEKEHIQTVLNSIWGFPGGSVAKNPPANEGDVGSFPGSGRFPLEQEMEAHSSILVWENPWTEEPGGSPWGHKWEVYDLAILCVHAKLLQSCPTLCDPKDCSPPGSSVHGILQARILEWIAGPTSRGSSRPRDWICVSYIYLHRQMCSLSLAPPGKPDLATKQHEIASGFAGPKHFTYLFIFKRYFFIQTVLKIYWIG